MLTNNIKFATYNKNIELRRNTKWILTGFIRI